MSLASIGLITGFTLTSGGAWRLALAPRGTA